MNLPVDKSLDISDHWPLWFEFPFDPEKKLCTKINWKNLNDEISRKFDSLDKIAANKTSIDISARLFREIILESIEKNSKTVELKPSSFKMTKEVVVMIKTKKKLQREYSYSPIRKLRQKLID